MEASSEILPLEKKMLQQPIILERPFQPLIPNTNHLDLLDSKKSSMKKSYMDVLDERVKVLQNLECLLSDQRPALVVGILGKEKLGKSFVLSSLAGNQGIFPSFADSDCHTWGLNAYMSPDNILFLDSQPLFSSFITTELKRKPFAVPESFKTRPRLWSDVVSQQLMKLLFNSCHVLLIVLESFDDEHFYNLLKYVAEIPLEIGIQPRIIFIYNQAGCQDYEPLVYNQACSKLSKLLGTSFSIQHSINLSFLFPELYSLSAVNLFLIPKKATKELKSIWDMKSFEELEYFESSPLMTFESSIQQIKTLILLKIPQPQESQIQWYKRLKDTWDAIKHLNLDYFTESVRRM
jgi:hypothetical protein